MGVFGIFIAVSFIGFIVTLVVVNIIKMVKKAQECNHCSPYSPYREYYVAEKSKDLELASKVLCDKPKSKVFDNTYDAWKNHDSQELFDDGKMSPVIGVRHSNPTVEDDYVKINVYSNSQGRTNKYLETIPSHKTRVALRKKRQRNK